MPRSQTSTLLKWSLGLSLTISLLLGAGVGTLQAHAKALAIPASSLAIVLFGAGTAGLLSGLTARLILQHWPTTHKVLLSLANLLIWMAVAELTAALWQGAPLFGFLQELASWSKLGPLAIGCLGILATSLAGEWANRPTPLGWVYRVTGRTAPAPDAQASLLWSLMLTVGIALLLGVGAGILQANRDELALPAHPTAISLIGITVVGLLTGLVSHLILRNRTEALKILTTLLALLIWIAAAEITYAEWIGLRPLDYLATANNWAEMGTLAVGCMAAIAGGLGRQIPQPVRRPSSQRRRRPAQERGAAGKPRKRRPSTAAPRARKEKRRLVPKPRLSIKARRTEPANENGVKVIGKAEERCPYCLDIVEKKDARGVVVCEICGSPHHADCWEAAGGTCQVPHLIT